VIKPVVFYGAGI
jgi:hypothetical protein